MVSFERKVQNYIMKHQLVEKGNRLLIACSGGVDSMGLLQFFLKVKKELSVELFVTHVDHMLRGEQSSLDRQFVEEFCQKHNIPIFSTAIPIPAILEQEGGNTQDVCRRERYHFFAEIMEKHNIQKLVTAHHADDQLESVLMSMVRTGTITSAKGIYPIREFAGKKIIRPFLTVTKDEIKKYLLQQNGSYREDGSNKKDTYTRNRFRLHIIPLLKKENEHVASHVVQFAEDLQQDDELLMELARKKFYELVKERKHKVYVLDINKFQKEHAALQRRVILILLKYLNENTHIIENRVLTTSILNLSRTDEGSATIDLPNGYKAYKQYGNIVFSKKLNFSKGASHELPLVYNDWLELNHGIRLYIGNCSNDMVESTEKYYFSSKQFSLPFKVRFRKEGDRLFIKGMEKPKRLSRIFIDEKIPLQYRDSWPILTDNNGEVVAVLGVRVHKYFSKHKRENDDMIIMVEQTL